MIGVTTCFVVNSPKVVYEMFEDEIVVVNLDNGNYYSIEGTGAEVWDDIVRGEPADQIAPAMAQRYADENATQQSVAQAVAQFLDELQREGLIVAISQPKSGAAPQLPQTPVGSTPEGAATRFTPPVLVRYTDMQDLLLLDPIHEVDETGWPNPLGDAAPTTS